jgi:cellulose synthase/poly-beta-1,6-N-acetylglucosamine synthase-like glycosyltransferase
LGLSKDVVVIDVFGDGVDLEVLPSAAPRSKMEPGTPWTRMKTSDDLPVVSVILPIRNESAFLRRSLGAVLGQNYPAGKLEVIVVDGMSTDDTREVVRELMSSHPNLSMRDNPSGIVPTAMNIGIRASRGTIIVRVDGHTVIDRDYARECVAAIQRTGADNVGGTMNAEGSGLVGEAIAVATTSPFGVGGSRFHYSTKEEWVDTVYMGAWPRSLFDRVGFFDEEMVRNQDDEFNFRIVDQGGKILLSPAIRSTYYPRDAVKSLWRQYFQYGFWKVRVMQKHPHRMRVHHIVPSLFVCSLSLTALFAQIWSGLAFLFIGVLGLYAVGATVATAIMKPRSRIFAFVPLVFAILHLGYGAGFLLGNLRFWNRWA